MPRMVYTSPEVLIMVFHGKILISRQWNNKAMFIIGMILPKHLICTIKRKRNFLLMIMNVQWLLKQNMQLTKV